MRFEIRRVLILPRLWVFLVASPLLALGPSGCRDGDTREEREVCMGVHYFAPEDVCGSPDDALRVARLNFVCGGTDPSCRIENVRGPFSPGQETGKPPCCYNYTVVRIDDGSYVN